ncbi:MAG: serine hydrolase domain-containing protein [Candidatus Sumerlaeaceae bacterium]
MNKMRILASVIFLCALQQMAYCDVANLNSVQRVAVTSGSVALTSGSVQAMIDPADAKPLDALIRTAMRRESIAGISFALVKDGHIAYLQSYGYADTESSLPVTSQTLFSIGSIAKTFTATAAMQLAEAGKLDLDAPIQMYVPYFPAKQWPVTSRQLLGHLGGIRSPGKEAFETSATAIVPGLSMFKDDALVHEPGSKFMYTNYGYVLLAAAVEKAVRRPFVTQLRESIFEPSGMTHTVQDHQASSPLLAKGYALVPKKNSRFLDRKQVSSYQSTLGPGGFCCTAEDLARFAIAFQTDRLVTSTTRNLMWTEQSTTSNTKTGYGLGWFVAHDMNGPYVAHGGFVPGYLSMLYILPEKQVAVVLLSNASNAKIGELARDLAAEASGEIRAW